MDPILMLTRSLPTTSYLVATDCPKLPATRYLVTDDFPKTASYEISRSCRLYQNCQLRNISYFIK